MDPLNKNNFLRWTGSFNQAPFDANAVDDSVNMFVTGAQVVLYPLVNDVSTYGIALNTFEFTLQDNPLAPATFDSASKSVTYFPPVGVVPSVKTLKYKWKDFNGNESNEATITINVLARQTAWRGDPSSFACEMSGGVRTGNSLYETLERYYTDDDELYLPYETKPNTIGDPDYIAPVTDNLNCNPEDFVEWLLTYGATKEDACTGGLGAVFYTETGVEFLAPGVQLYTDEELTSPAGNDYFAPGNGQVFRVVSGTIVDQLTC